MSKQRALDFARIVTPNLKAYDIAANYSNETYQEREKSRTQKLVNRACKTETILIDTVVAARNLDEMIALELRLQNNDLEKYTRSANEVQNVEQGLTDFRRGIHSYNTLKNDPRQYKDAAEGYTDRNRDKRLNVPKDGMRYALASQMTRLQNRQSLQLSEDEKNLLTARRNLINAIREEYSLLQEKVVHGDADMTTKINH